MKKKSAILENHYTKNVEEIVVESEVKTKYKSAVRAICN